MKEIKVKAKDKISKEINKNLKIDATLDEALKVLLSGKPNKEKKTKKKK